MKIWKPLMCASLLGLACSLPAQAHGPWTDTYSRSQATTSHMDGNTSAMWDTGTSRDPMGMPTHGAWGTGSMITEQSMAVSEIQGGYRSEPVTPQRPSYAPAPRDRRWSDDYQMRGY
ncbi:MAG: hypothetical protein K0Q76_755 [Panacagrimonas sp.]|jgi:hypothetical protein|nr:hypothetical protein [Panacagrimonas sp.]MCC2655647.1 hypothetical protein [Panacagrimonas sp.]